MAAPLAISYVFMLLVILGLASSYMVQQHTQNGCHSSEQEMICDKCVQITGTDIGCCSTEGAFQLCTQCVVNPMLCMLMSSQGDDEIESEEMTPDSPDAEIFKQDKRYGSLGIGSSWRSRQPPRQYPGRRNGPRKGIAGTPESLQDIILRYNVGAPQNSVILPPRQ